MKLHIFLLTAILLSTRWAAAEDSHWSYPDLDLGEEFPSWGGVCDTGKQQSPINLVQSGSLKGVFGEFKFDNYDEDQVGVTMVNNGHSIQLSDFPKTMTLSGGVLNSEYIVEQFHVHWWSEHTVENIRYPMEVHIVHYNKRYGNFTEALNHNDGVVVIAILFHVSNEANSAIDSIISHLDEVKSYKQLNQAILIKEPFIIRDLFPQFDSYMTYSGSLTTPACTEVVTWVVLRESFPVTFEQINRFKEIEYEDGKLLKNNYRNIQATNNRPVVIVFNEKSTDGAATLSTSFAVVLLVAIVGCKRLL